MSGDWGNPRCPHCGTVPLPPDTGAARTESERIFVDIHCLHCGGDWTHGVDLWRYYGIQEHLPSREEDR